MWVLVGFVCPLSFVPTSFVGMEILVLLAIVCVSVCVSFTLPVVSKHPIASCSHLTSGNT